MNVTLEFEADDKAVELTFIVENVDGENEWSIDYNYIDTREDGGPHIPRTWIYLNQVYDPGVLAKLKDDAIAYAIDNFDPADDHLEDDEGD